LFGLLKNPWYSRFLSLSPTEHLGDDEFLFLGPCIFFKVVVAVPEVLSDSDFELGKLFLLGRGRLE
jgi:hypothetical protein